MLFWRLLHPPSVLDTHRERRRMDGDEERMRRMRLRGFLRTAVTRFTTASSAPSSSSFQGTASRTETSTKSYRFYFFFPLVSFLCDYFFSDLPFTPFFPSSLPHFRFLPVSHTLFCLFECDSKQESLLYTTKTNHQTVSHSH